jgi:hypothetical protein
MDGGVIPGLLVALLALWAALIVCSGSSGRTTSGLRSACGWCPTSSDLSEVCSGIVLGSGPRAVPVSNDRSRIGVSLDFVS